MVPASIFMNSTACHDPEETASKAAYTKQIEN